MQHLFGWGAGLAIQAVDQHASLAVSRIADFRHVKLPFKTMFGTEQCNQRDVGRCMQNTCGTAAITVDTRVICDQGDARIFERRKQLCLQDVNACHYLRGFVGHTCCRKTETEQPGAKDCATLDNKKPEDADH